MIRLTFLIFILFFLSNCSFNEKSRLWKDKEKKIISGDSEKIKTVYDTWVFSRDLKSNNPNWLLIDTLT